jgi:hypothetical protein
VKCSPPTNTDARQPFAFGCCPAVFSAEEVAATADNFDADGCWW